MRGTRIGRGAMAGWPADRLTAVVAATALCASLVALLPTPRAAAAGTTFDPLPNATAVEAGVYSSVVADGAGTFHSVMRQDSPVQSIVYRRSTDGGRSWLQYGRWEGEAGGATDPVIAVSGTRVVIMFLGGFCQGSLCGRAPYLVGSIDAGASFGAPVRMASNASAVAVGIAGERTWVAWQMRNATNDDVVVLKGYSPSFALLKETAIPGYSPRIAAGGNGGVLTMVREDLTGGQRALLPTAQLLDGDALGKREDLPAVPVDAAVAEGRAHLLFREGRNLLVRTAPVSGTAGFGSRVLALVGEGGSIVARPGLVAVAAVDQATGVSVVARSADGGTFSRPREVATTKDRPYRVELALATLPADRPTIALGWSVPPRYADRDGDAFPDPANSGSAPTLPVTPSTLAVTLDACASRPGEGATLDADSYEWTRDGQALGITGCTGAVDMAEGQTAVIGLEVTDSNGATSVRTLEVTPKDLLVVSMGDSVASGEGNPHVDAPSETWEDGPCHRTHFAGPALAAQRLEQADPHTSVTFVQLACSGAAIMDVPTVPGAATDGTDPNTGGILDGYHGVEPDASGARPSQLAQMASLIGDRVPDAVTLSIGANDVVFSDVLTACLVGPCLLDGTKAILDQRLADLPRRYAALGDALGAANVPDEAVFLTEYYDVASNSLGLSDLKCVANAQNTALLSTALSAIPGYGPFLGPLEAAILGDGLVTDDEAAWSKEYLGARINEEVRAGAAAQGWRVVGGFDAAFARHGYCADEPWVVTVPTSFLTQLDEFGSFHPNRSGHQEYGRRLGAALTRSLITPEESDAETPVLPVGDLYLVTSGTGEATIAALGDEGKDVVPLGQRTLDRVASGDGYVAGLAPAADATSAVATWTQLAQGSVMTWRSLLAQVALRENIALTSASFSQAAERATFLVPGRPTTVLARFRIDTAGPSAVEVGVTVTDETTGDEVSSETERFWLNPGHGMAALPVADVLIPEPGHRYSARVTVKDPESAGPAGAADNALEISADDFPALVPTRPLDLIAVPLLVEGAAVDCADMMARLPSWAQRASAMMPVANEVSLDGGCATVGASLTGDPIPATDKGVAEALVTLDYLARITGRDGVVGVAPKDWLKQVRPIIGVAIMGGRGLIVDAAASESTFAHELSHNLTIEHRETTAAGVWLERRQFRQGVDYMAAEDAPDWVSRRTWDGLVEAIGGPETAPKPPAPDARGLWVRGWVYPVVDGAGNIRWSPTTATWVRAEGGSRLDPDLLLDTLGVSFRVQQLDADGAELGEAQPVALGPVDGRYVRGADHGEPPAYGYNALVEPLDGAAEVVLTMTDADGTREVDRRTIGAAPEVAVTAPAAGSEAGRGSTLEVAWTVQDADTAASDLTTDLLVSGDGGATWEPLATDVGDSPASITVPADLDGDDVRVRVVVSDGVQAGSADSEPFTVGGPKVEVSERVAFHRALTYNDSVTNKSRLFTMDPDGAAEVELDLPRVSTWETKPANDGEGGVIGYVCPNPFPDGTCAADYEFPSWSPDGSRLYFSSDLVDTHFGGAADAGVKDRIWTHLWSVKPDGSDLRRVTQPQTSPQVEPVASYSVHNVCVDVGSDRIAWLGYGVPRFEGELTPDLDPQLSIYSAAADGSGQARAFGWVPTLDNLNPESWPTFLGSGWDPVIDDLTIHTARPDTGINGLRYSCPMISPDGTRIAFQASVQKSAIDPATGLVGHRNYANAILVMGSDGSDLAVVTDYLDFDATRQQWQGVDWLDNDSLVVTKMQQGSASICTYTYQPHSVDLTASSATTTPLAPPHGLCVGPKDMKVAPDGQVLYGDVYNPVPGGDTNFALLNPGDTPTIVAKAARDAYFDWGRAVTVTGPDVPVVTPAVVVVPKADAGGPYSATAGVPLVLAAGGSALADDPLASASWDLDGDGQFDDAEGRNPEVVFPEAGSREIRVRVTPGSGSAVTSDPSAVTVVPAPEPQFEVDPGAEGSAPPRPPVGPVALRVSIPAGVPTEVRLGPDGAPGPFVVTEVEEAALLVESGDGAPLLPGLATSGPAGTIRVTADPAFRGIARFSYAHGDDPTRTEIVEVEVTGNAAPIAADDTLAGRAGVRMELAPATLLVNDSDPDGEASGLRVVSVTGMTVGSAWLSADGDVVTVVPGSSSGSFTYTIADAAGAIDSATVRVTVPGPTAPTTAPPTTPPPTPPPTPPTTPLTPPPPTPPTTTPPRVPPDIAPVVTTRIPGKVYFKYKSVKLTKAEKRKLRRMVARIPDDATVVLSRSIGMVRAKDATRADRRRALERATVVRDYLVARGLTGPIIVTNSGRTKGTTAKARRVNVTITYTVTR